MAQPYQFDVFEAVASCEVTQNAAFVCDVCNKNVKSRFSLRRHFLRLHVNPHYISRTDIKKYKVSSKENPNGAIYVCHSHELYFDKKGELRQHWDATFHKNCLRGHSKVDSKCEKTSAQGRASTRKGGKCHLPFVSNDDAMGFVPSEEPTELDRPQCKSTPNEWIFPNSPELAVNYFKDVTSAMLERSFAVVPDLLANTSVGILPDLLNTQETLQILLDLIANTSVGILPDLLNTQDTLQVPYNDKIDSCPNGIYDWAEFFCPDLHLTGLTGDEHLYEDVEKFMKELTLIGATTIFNQYLDECLSDLTGSPSQLDYGLPTLLGSGKVSVSGKSCSNSQNALISAMKLDSSDEHSSEAQISSILVPKPGFGEKIVQPPFTDEMEAIVMNAIAGGPIEAVIIEAYNQCIRRKDINTLLDRQWLNDEVVNFYLNMIVERSQTSSEYCPAYAFNTFFHPKIVKEGHAGVKRWTRKVDIFAHELIFVPVHLGVHWCMAVIDMTNKSIRYYDSMGASNESALRKLLEYLEAESLDKKNIKLDSSDWKLENVKGIPQQSNGSDCGVFACKFAEYESRRAPITFSQEDMACFRRRMIYEISTKNLVSPGNVEVAADNLKNAV